MSSLNSSAKITPLNPKLFSNWLTISCGVAATSATTASSGSSRSANCAGRIFHRRNVPAASLAARRSAPRLPSNTRTSLPYPPSASFGNFSAAPNTSAPCSALRIMLRDFPAQPLQPRPAILLIQRNSPPHLLDVCWGMKIVPLFKLPSQLLSQQTPHRRLSRPVTPITTTTMLHLSSHFLHRSSAAKWPTAASCLAANTNNHRSFSHCRNNASV